MGTSERAYTTSHPWISFRIDLSRPDPELWMLLGEARSKIDHLSLALLKPDVAQDMQRVFLAKGARATTAIEGNTLDEDEVAAIVEGRAAEPPPSQEYLYREVENVILAFNAITGHLLAGGDGELRVESILGFNRDVLAGLDDDDVHPGILRTGSVVVGPYRGAPAEDCPFLLERLCEWLNGPDFDRPEGDWAVPLALIKAIIGHLYLAWIHPFDDGNGRTARLMEFQILLAAGVPMPAAHLLSNHYNTTRAEYYRQLARASASGGDVLPFLRYAIRGFVDGIRAQLDVVWDQQYADRWEQFIYETFGTVTTDADRRRLRLVKEMSLLESPISRREIPRLDPELAVAYSGTERMLSRDLNALAAMGLIENVGRGMWWPRREQILAFRPVRRSE